MVAAAVVRNIRYLKNSDVERKIHRKKVAKLKAKLAEQNIKIIDNNSHIISIIIGDAALSKKISQKLLDEHKIYIQNKTNVIILLNLKLSRREICTANFLPPCEKAPPTFN